MYIGILKPTEQQTLVKTVYLTLDATITTTLEKGQETWFTQVLVLSVLKTASENKTFTHSRPTSNGLSHYPFVRGSTAACNVEWVRSEAS